VWQSFDAVAGLRIVLPGDEVRGDVSGVSRGAPGERVPAPEWPAAHLPPRLTDMVGNRAEPSARPVVGVAVVAAGVPAQVEHDPVEGEMPVGGRAPAGEQSLVVAIADQPSDAEDEDALDDLLLDRRARLVLPALPFRPAGKANVLVPQRLTEVALELGDGFAPGGRTVCETPLPRGHRHVGRIHDSGGDPEVALAQQPGEELCIPGERAGVARCLGATPLGLRDEAAQAGTLRIEEPVDARPLAPEVDAQRGSWIQASTGATRTRRPIRRRSSPRNSHSETACSSPRSSGATPAGT
jgi:hypothetical protein